MKCKIKWPLIFFAILAISFVSGIFLHSCEQARGAEMCQELRILVNEFNEAGKELTWLAIRISTVETVFLEKIEE